MRDGGLDHAGVARLFGALIGTVEVISGLCIQLADSFAISFHGRMILFDKFLSHGLVRHRPLLLRTLKTEFRFASGNGDKSTSVVSEMLVKRRASLLSFQPRVFHRLAKFFVFRTTRYRRPPLEIVQALQVRLCGAIVLLDKTSFIRTDRSYSRRFHVWMVDTNGPMFVSALEIYL